MDRTMAAASASVEVPLSPESAFELYTAGIDRWWRLGTIYWNDRERATGLRFEPFVGGRFIEVYDAQTGDGFQIGRVESWEPGRRLAYTWREKDWPPEAQTLVEVTFEATPLGTRVEVRHSGWDTVPDGAETSRGYAMGTRELLAWYEEAAGPGE
jgi:uncharacterized protein YndB with AHSA1/START domain